jgi:thioredoxin 1
VRNTGWALLLGTLVLIGCGAPERDGTEGHASLKLSGENFTSEVLESDKPVLVDFWATWCGPCKQMAPVVEQLAGDFQDRVTVGKLDVDPQIAVAHRIEALPTFVVFKNGQEVERIVGGGRSKAEMARVLEKHL